LISTCVSANHVGYVCKLEDVGGRRPWSTVSWDETERKNAFAHTLVAVRN
jgi:hypothetical protein